MTRTLTPAPAPTGADPHRPAPNAQQLLDEVVAAIGGARRDSQHAMADLVADALATGRHTLIEAGTGTGKSLAYLAPALAHIAAARAGAADLAASAPGQHLAGAAATGRVVVATATKALQDQIADKDLPALTPLLAAAGHPVSTAVRKGRRNYLCQARLAELREQAAAGMTALFGTGPVISPTTLDELAQAAEAAGTGDRSALPALEDEQWNALSVGAEECPGAGSCPFAAACWAEKAFAAAASADLVVVNHHLYATDLLSGGTLLGPHDAVILDEAHAFEDVVARTTGATLSPTGVRAAAGAFTKAVLDAGSAATFAAAEQALVAALAGCDDGRVDTTEDPVATALAQVSAAANAATTALAAAGAAASAAGTTLSAARHAQAVKACAMLAQTADALATPASDTVCWVERTRRGTPVLTQATVDVSGFLADTLYPQTTLVATSATLTVAGDFTALAGRLGLTLTPAAHPAPARVDCPAPGQSAATPGPASSGGAPDRADTADTSEVPVWRTATGHLCPSDFDYPRQGILYVAADLPDPRSEKFPAAATGRLADLADAAGGRTLALFTSRAAMRAAADTLAATGRFHVLTQDDGPRAHVLAQFTSTPRAVLCATSSYWTGVDIKGTDALACVVIDKLPFPRRGEPLGDARRRAAARARQDPFATIDLPHTARELAQGVGRLIRDHDDRGIVAVLDPRLAAKSYGRTLLASLPAFYRTTDTALALAALRRLTATLTPQAA